jgi:hypothetical protein
VPQARRCAACKAVFDPDLEQGGNTNIVVRRDPATGDILIRSSTAGAVSDATSDKWGQAKQPFDVMGDRL